MNSRQFATLAVLVILSGLLGGMISVRFLLPESVMAQDSRPKVIEAEEFRVVDREGRTRARLRTANLVLFDEGGEVRVALATDSYPGLSLSGKDGKPKAGLSVFKDGPGLRLWGRDGKPKAGLLYSKMDQV